MKQYRLKAGALLYAIFVAIITAILLSSVILLFYYRVINAYVVEERIQLQANVESAIQLLKSNPTLLENTDTLSLKLFEDEQVQLKRQWWGVYQIISISSDKKHLSSKADVLIGDDLFHEKQIAFYLKEDRNHLSVVGKTKISGTAYLPKLGIRKGYISGKTFSGTKPVIGQIKQSSTKLPELHNRLSDYGRFSDDQTRNAEQHLFEELLEKKTIESSFKGKTIHFFADHAVQLAGFDLKGKIIIESKHSISVGADTKLQDVILIAPKIFVNYSKLNSFQAFAKDTLVVKEGINLNYPTTLCLIQNKSVLLAKQNKSLLKIGKKSKVEGSVIVNELNVNNKALLTIEEDVEIKGITYCNGETNFSGKQIGSLYVDELVYYGKSAIYKNHLLNAEISFIDFPKNFSTGIIFQNRKKRMLTKWVQ